MSLIMIKQNNSDIQQANDLGDEAQPIIEQ
jgi:hypothetical protein